MPPTPEEIEVKKQEDAKKAADDAKEFETRVSKIVNSALTAHNKRQPEGVTAEALTKMLDERDAKREELAEEKRKAKEAGGSGAGGANNAPEIAKLQKELEAIKKEAAAARAESFEQKQKQQVSEDKTLLMKTLEGAGVTVAGRARAAMNHLLSEGLVKRTDEGLVGIDKSGDEQELAETITEFLKTDDGKIFLPPSDARGSGSDKNRGGGTGKAPKNAKERAGNALSAYRTGAGS